MGSVKTFWMFHQFWYVTYLSNMKPTIKDFLFSGNVCSGFPKIFMGEMGLGWVRWLRLSLSSKTGSVLCKKIFLFKTTVNFSKDEEYTI